MTEKNSGWHDTRHAVRHLSRCVPRFCVDEAARTRGAGVGGEGRAGAGAGEEEVLDSFATTTKYRHAAVMFVDVCGYSTLGDKLRRMSEHAIEQVLQDGEDEDEFGHDSEEDRGDKELVGNGAGRAKRRKNKTMVGKRTPDSFMRLKVEPSPSSRRKGIASGGKRININAQTDALQTPVESSSLSSMKRAALGSTGGDLPGADERLASILSGFLGGIVDVVVAHGGDVLKFAGDAIVAIWYPTGKSGVVSDDDSPKSAEMRALGAAVAIQRFCERYAGPTELLGSGGDGLGIDLASLQCKIGLGTGDAQLTLASGERHYPSHAAVTRPTERASDGGRSGEEERRTELVVTGEALQQSTACEMRAEPGDIIASHRLVEMLDAGLAKPAPESETIQLASFFQPVRKSAAGEPVLAYKLDFQRLVEERSAAVQWLVADGNIASISASEPVVAVPERHRAAVASRMGEFLPSSVAESVRHGLSVEPEIRVLSVVFCMLERKKGSSGASARSPRDIAELMRAVTPIVTGFGGEIRQLILDDKGLVLIALWGVKRRTDDALRSVLVAQRLALEGKLPLGYAARVGVTRGKVFIGPVGSRKTRFEWAAVGDTVNLSARLMTRAGHSEVLVDDETRLAAAGATFREFDSAMCVKGKAATIRVFACVPDESVSSHIIDGEKQEFQSSYAAVGHHREMVEELISSMRPSAHQFLTDSMNWAYASLSSLSRNRGGIKRCVTLLTGEAGCGKSAMLEYAVLKLMEEHGDSLVFCRVSCCAPDANLPLHCWYTPLTELSSLAENDDEVSGTTTSSRSSHPLLVRAGPIPQMFVGSKSANLSEGGVLRQIDAASQALDSHGQHLLILVEDLHWADVSTLSVLNTLAMIHSDVIHVVATSRDLGSYSSPQAKSQFKSLVDRSRSLNFQPLNDSEMREFLAFAVDARRLSKPVATTLIPSARGLPVNGLEIVRHLVRRELIHVDDSGTLVCSASCTQKRLKHLLPESLSAPVIEQLDQLSPVHRELVKTLAVLDVRGAGDIVSRADTILAVNPRKLQTLRMCLGAAVRDILQQTSILSRVSSNALHMSSSALIMPSVETRASNAEIGVKFSHDLVREVVYSSIPFDTRCKMHKRAGQILFGFPNEAESGLAAFHFDRAGATTLAIHAYDRAARIALSSSECDPVDIVQRLNALLAMEGLQNSPKGIAWRLVAAQMHIVIESQHCVPMTRDLLTDLRERSSFGASRVVLPFRLMRQLATFRRDCIRPPPRLEPRGDLSAKEEFEFDSRLLALACSAARLILDGQLLRGAYNFLRFANGAIRNATSLPLYCWAVAARMTLLDDHFPRVAERWWPQTERLFLSVLMPGSESPEDEQSTSSDLSGTSVSVKRTTGDSDDSSSNEGAAEIIGQIRFWRVLVGQSLALHRVRQDQLSGLLDEVAVRAGSGRPRSPLEHVQDMIIQSFCRLYVDTKLSEVVRSSAFAASLLHDAGTTDVRPPVYGVGAISQLLYDPAADVYLPFDVDQLPLPKQHELYASVSVLALAWSHFYAADRKWADVLAALSELTRIWKSRTEVLDVIFAIVLSMPLASQLACVVCVELAVRDTKSSADHPPIGLVRKLSSLALTLAQFAEGVLKRFRAGRRTRIGVEIDVLVCTTLCNKGRGAEEAGVRLMELAKECKRLDAGMAGARARMLAGLMAVVAGDGSGSAAKRLKSAKRCLAEAELSGHALQVVNWLDHLKRGKKVGEWRRPGGLLA